MEVVRSIGQPFTDPRPSVVSVGVFDAIHRGHEALLAQTVERAADIGAAPAVVTFDPHPLVVVMPERAPCTLATVDQRLARIGALGIERSLMLEFTHELSLIEPEDFVRSVLVESLRARCVVVGEDFRFGHKRRGDLELLRAQGGAHGFEVVGFALVADDGEQVSSTTIRRLIAEGDVKGAAALLGHDYALAGTVVHGDHRGRSLGFPTANLAPHPRACLPGRGVYAGRWLWRGQRLPGVVNVGVRPTFGEGDPPLVEIHVFDLDEDLYGEAGEVEFVTRLRPERKFPSVDALVEQIRTDAAEARRILSV